MFKCKKDQFPYNGHYLFNLDVQVLMISTTAMLSMLNKMRLLDNLERET